MNKPGKRDTSLNERDALSDMLAAERALLAAYAEAAWEGERSLRTAYAELFSQTAEDAHSLAAARGEDAPQGEAEKGQPPLAALRAWAAEQKKQLRSLGK